MFWEAAQEDRLDAERRQWTAAFVGARDGTLAAQLGGRKVWPAGVPDYAAPERPVRTGDDLFRDFAHLVRDREE